MKKLLFSLFLFTNVFSTFAQTDLDVNYMELRLMGRKGWQFRTSPNTFFQPMGFFGQRIKPYLREDALAYQSFKKYRSNTIGTIGATTLLSMSISTTMFGFFEQERQWTALGVSGILIGGGLLYFANNWSLKHLQASVDYYNRAKNPTLTHFERFIPSFSASRHSLGIGLVWNVY